MATGATSLVRRTTRALGRELADGFLERRPEILAGVHDVANTVGSSITASVIDQVAVEGETGDDGPGREGKGRELDAAVHRLGRTATLGATEGIARGTLLRVAIPFGAGVLATLILTRSLGRHGSQRAG